jgi:hypothetical protein
MSIEFDLSKRPPAARLLSILVTGALVGALVSSGGRLQADQLKRDPAQFYRHIAAESTRSPLADIVISIILVTVIVFVVDALTALLSRWLKESDTSDKG